MGRIITAEKKQLVKKIHTAKKTIAAGRHLRYEGRSVFTVLSIRIICYDCCCADDVKTVYVAMGLLRSLRFLGIYISEDPYGKGRHFGFLRRYTAQLFLFSHKLVLKRAIKMGYMTAGYI